MRRIISIFIFNLFLVSAFAQTKAAFIRAGEKALTDHDFFSAMNYFEEALSFPGAETTIRYQYGEAARQFYAYDLAVQQYQFVLNDKKSDRFPLTKFWLSSAYQSMGKYQKAINGFDDFINNTHNAIFKEKALAAKESCQWALSMVQQPHDIEVTHLDKKINTPYSEFGALKSGDTLYYSSYRYQTSAQTTPRKRISKVLNQIGTARGRPLTRKFNETDRLTAHTSLTPDGQRIYYTVCEYIGEVDIRCDIYFKDQDKRKRWGSAQKLPETINLPGFTTTQPSWGLDPATKKPVLYFSSDRPGGNGGLDIYQVEITKNGFGIPTNLNSINTVADDITPFYHQISQSLFFSSKGYQSLGGYDIFQTKHNGTVWEKPMHTGYPLNSSYNDVYFSLNADSTQAYLSSNREGSFYLEEKNKACCNDIFMVKINPPLPTAPVLDTNTIVQIPPIKPEILDTTNNSVPPPVVSVPQIPEIPEPPVIPTEIPVTPPEIIPEPPIVTTVEKLKSVLPLPLYFHNDRPDRRSFLETTSTNYQTTFDDYVQRRDEYLNAVLEEKKSSVVDFFDRDLKGGYETFLEFCEGLVIQLQSGKKITLTLKGHTSPRAQSDYNLALGKRRTVAVINFFKNYQDGIFDAFLKNGKFKIKQISYGESLSPTSVSDLLTDRRGSIYVPEAARERRVELVGIKVE